MQSFIAENIDFTSGRVILIGEEHHHATRSCRVRPGEEIGITDGAGKRVIARIGAIGPNSLEAVIERDVSGVGELPVPLTLVLALIKPGMFEMAAEKATELGVRRVAPLICERSMYGPARLNTERLERIIRSAVKQSGRSYIPAIAEPCTVNELIGRLGDIRLYIADCNTEQPFPASLPVSEGGAIIAVGPEGDFTPAELESLCKAGGVPFSLGGLVLRAETAAIAATVVAAGAMRGTGC